MPHRRWQRIERRGSLTQDGDPFVDKQGVEFVRRTRHLVGHHNQPTTAEQRTEDLPHREVESQRMKLGPGPTPWKLAFKDSSSLTTFWWVIATPFGVPVVPEVYIRYATSRARSRQRRAGQGVNPQVSTSTTRPSPSTRSAKSVVASTAIGAASASMNPTRASGKPDRWQIRRPGLQHRHDRHHRLSRTGQQNTHTFTRACTTTNQQMRQPIRRRIELPVTQGLTPKAHRPASGAAATRTPNNCGIDTAPPTGPFNPARSPNPSSQTHSSRRGHRSTKPAWSYPQSPPPTAVPAAWRYSRHRHSGR